MNLKDWIVHRLEGHRRLAGVPAPVIEEVVSLAINELDCELPVSEMTTIGDVLGAEWTQCERCREWIDCAVAVSGGDDCDLCRDCAKLMAANAGSVTP